LETALPPDLVRALGENFRVAAEAVSQAREDLVRRFPETVFALPEPMPVDLLPAIAPVPCLRLETRRFDTGWGSEAITVDLACLSFDYAGRRLRRSDPLSWVEDRRVLRLSRNQREEQACLQRLAGLGFFLDKKWSESTGTDSLLLPGPPEDWLELQYRAVPELIEEGWRVEFADGFRFQLAQTGRWTAELEPGPGNDWFNFSIGVETEAGPVNLLPALVRFIQEAPGDFRQERLRHLDDERPLFVPLADGRLLAIPLARLRPMLETLFELYDPGSLDAEERLRVGRFQLARLAELQELPQAGRLDWLGGEQLRRMGERLRAFAQLQPVTPPTGLRPQLRDYQRSGLDWLQFLRRSGLAGILADDMGLGKTLQTLAHLLLEKEQGRLDRPALVVAPTSLMFNWRREAERFTPALKVLTLQGPDRHTRFARIAGHDLVLTTYPLLARDRERLLEQAFHLLILDEAQVIKNPKSQASRVVRDLVARHRLCLTGTPMENHLGELWSLYDFLLPGLLGTRRQFTRAFRTPIEKDGDQAVSGLLARRLRPFLLRRTKEQVVAELPPKTEILRSVRLEGAQRDLYESIRLAMHERVRKEVASRGLARSRLLILDSLLKLRQVCCDPRLVRLESARKVRQSAKLDLLMTLLPEMVEEGRRILLFSQFTSMLSLIEEALQQTGLRYVKLTGRSRDRATPVTRFQADEVPLFLISLKAGGVGLNLTAADTVIHYDPWWNPAVERQATDRAHRLGQDKPVFVYKLISDGTVEERMQALQTRKQALADGLYHTEESTEPQWTEADLDLLFEPLD
jgi:superfamily II DNA or RNA helicase